MQKKFWLWFFLSSPAFDIFLKPFLLTVREADFVCWYYGKINYRNRNKAARQHLFSTPDYPKYCAVLRFSPCSTSARCTRCIQKRLLLEYYELYKVYEKETDAVWRWIYFAVAIYREENRNRETCRLCLCGKSKSVYSPWTKLWINILG